MEKDCIFCKIIAGEVPADKFYEDNNFVAMLDIGPVSTGHTLLIPKDHFVNIFDTPDEVLAKIGPVIKKISQAIKTGVKADGLNVHINNGKDAGQAVFHTHVHLIPRFKGDDLVHWQAKGHPTREEFEETKNKITSEL
ncbi:MAG TPA: HIT family protein [Candidatus Paceibacterota bacterium]|nr:HIT family protein [Candidatus Paceibacterota bacterium]